MAPKSKFTGPADTRLVYSTDPRLNERCVKCKELFSGCICPKEEDVKKDGKGYKFVAVLRIEKGMRAGKTVTVIDQLPKNELFLKTLTSELKKTCGSGGTYHMTGREGSIEIQGDKRDLLRRLLEKRGIRVKG